MIVDLFFCVPVAFEGVWTHFQCFSEKKVEINLKKNPEILLYFLY